MSAAQERPTTTDERPGRSTWHRAATLGLLALPLLGGCGLIGGGQDSAGRADPSVPDVLAVETAPIETSPSAVPTEQEAAELLVGALEHALAPRPVTVTETVHPVPENWFIIAGRTIEVIDPERGVRWWHRDFTEDHDRAVAELIAMVVADAERAADADPDDEGPDETMLPAFLHTLRGHGAPLTIISTEDFQWVEASGPIEASRIELSLAALLYADHLDGSLVELSRDTFEAEEWDGRWVEVPAGSLDDWVRENERFPFSLVVSLASADLLAETFLELDETDALAAAVDGSAIDDLVRPVSVRVLGVDEGVVSVEVGPASSSVVFGIDADGRLTFVETERGRLDLEWEVDPDLLAPPDPSTIVTAEEVAEALGHPTESEQPNDTIPKFDTIDDSLVDDGS